MDVLGHSRDAWNGYVATGNRWTVPVDPDVVARARQGALPGATFDHIVPCLVATRAVK